MTTTGERPATAARVRTGVDAAWAVGALAVLLATAALSRDSRVPAWEEAVFHAVNERTVLPFAVIWPVMQLGNVAVVLLCAAVAAGTRRFRLAGALVLGGLIAYVLAKVVKAAVERPRPGPLLDEVVVRGPQVSDFGFVSGHATVATVVAAILLPYVGRRVRWAFVGVALLVGLTRVYVGAHLPLDVVGGAALAVLVAAAVHLALGRPPGRRESLS